MTDETTKIIENAIISGTDKHATRRELVSQGLSTKDFDNLYAETLKRLGVAEPKMAMPTLAPSGEAPLRQPLPRKKPIKFFIEVVIVFLLVAGFLYFGLHRQVMVWLLDTIPSGVEHGELKEGEETTTTTFADGVLKKKVDATFASVQIYRGRMLDYQGACTGVSVIAPIMCQEKKETVAIFTRLSDGSYYCVDGAGKVGTSPFSTEGEVGCK